MARQDTACSDLDRSVQEHKNAAHYDELEKELLVNENYGEVSSAPWYVNLHDKISNILNRDKKRTFVTNTEIRKYLRKKYGPLEGERIELVNSIYQILKQNPTIARHFYKYVNGELGMLDAQKMRQQFPDYEITTFENSDIQPLIEYRDGQVCSVNSPMTKCEQVAHDISVKGYKNTVDEYTVPGYNIGHYKATGSTE